MQGLNDGALIEPFEKDDILIQAFEGWMS